jgi:hypothetical protein
METRPALPAALSVIKAPPRAIRSPFVKGEGLLGEIIRLSEKYEDLLNQV